jgi:PRTRC genetic system protein E
MSLFTGIENLRGQVKAVGIVLTFIEDGRISVVVNPVVDDATKEKTPALAHGFGLTGTAPELDEGFAGHFAGIAQKRTTLAEQAAAQIAALKLPKPAAKPATGGASTTVSGKSKPTGTVVEFEDDDTPAGDGASGKSAMASESTATAGDLTATSLF